MDTCSTRRQNATTGCADIQGEEEKRRGDLDVIGNGALLELGFGLDHVFDTAA